MPAFSLPHNPPEVPSRLHLVQDAPLPNNTPALQFLAPASRVAATASAVRLSPATLSAQNHLTSELLRTLSRMAASKPTSWLSQQLYLLNHLAYIRDLNWRSGLFPSWPWILSLIASLPNNNITGIRSLTLFGTTFRRPHKTSALPPVR